MNNIPYEEIIEKEGFYIATIVGNSMLPMLRSRDDSVKIVKPKFPLKKGKLVLYQSKNETYRLYRIIKVKNNRYYLCGDGEWRAEKGVKSYQIVGEVEGFYKKDKYKPVTKLSHRLYIFFWLKTRPLRYLFFKLFKRKKHKNGQ